MDFYQQYDRCCVISLCNPQALIFVEKHLGCLSIGGEYELKYSRTKIFGQQRHTQHLEADIMDTTDKNYIYVEDATKQLYQLYTATVSGETDVQQNSTFIAIAKYIRSCLYELCENKKIQFSRLYLVFMIPDEWGLKSNLNDGMINLIMVPLLKEIGCILSADYRDRALIITHLEATLSFFQLGSSITSLSFIHNESKCIVYEFYNYDTAITIKSKYFQMKEDYNLRTFNENYYTPKILSMDDGLTIDMINLHTLVKTLRSIVQKIYEKEVLMGLSMMKKLGKISISVDTILDLVLDRITGDFEEDDIHRIIYENHKDVLMKLEMASKIVTKELRQLLSTQLQTMLTYVITQNNKIPFHRKSVVYNRDYQSKILKIFFQLLDCDIYDAYKKENNLAWHNLPERISEKDLLGGAALLAARKAMISNINQPPVVITKHRKSNNIGLPLYFPLYQAKKNCNPLKHIVYIDISQVSTCIVCETVDKNGRIIKQVTMDVNNVKKTSLNAMIAFRDVINDTKEAQKEFDRRTKEKQQTHRLSNMRYKRPVLLLYIRHLISQVNYNLQGHNFELNKCRYVLSVEKTIMDRFYIRSRRELLEFLKDSRIFKPDNTRKDFTVTDQGEKLVWDMYQKQILESLSYYVHAHITDDYIYLKLNQVVDISKANAGRQLHSVIFIKGQTIKMENTYQQVSEKLWTHIQSLDDLERSCFVSSENNLLPNDSKTLKLFKSCLTHFIKQKLFCNENSETSGIKQKLKLSETCTILITIQELMDIAIAPVVKQTASAIISCLIDEGNFGHYEITKLFITGTFVRVQEYNDVYDYNITMQLRQELDQLIRGKTHRTIIYISIETCVNYKQLLQSTDSKYKSFCYDIFLKGELRLVANATYFTLQNHPKLYNRWRKPYEKDLLFITTRGAELVDKSQKANFFTRETYTSEHWPAFFKYSEPCSLQDIHKKSLFHMERHPGNFASNGLNIIHLQVLHYSGCIKITFENNRKSGCYTRSLVFGERQTLAYF